MIDFGTSLLLLGTPKDTFLPASSEALNQELLQRCSAPYRALNREAGIHRYCSMWLVEPAANIHPHLSTIAKSHDHNKPFSLTIWQRPVPDCRHGPFEF
jgi:hypothetical protein